MTSGHCLFFVSAHPSPFGDGPVPLIVIVLQIRKTKYQSDKINENHCMELQYGFQKESGVYAGP